jgi:hypothetical protein
MDDRPDTGAEDPFAEMNPSEQQMRILTLKHRVATSGYTVDPVAVAEAMLRSAEARRLLLPSLSRGGARSPRAASPRRLP